MEAAVLILIILYTCLVLAGIFVDDKENNTKN
jgi:hypothetical protein